ncbi:Calcium/Calmodulin-Dependent 3',5'-Cyclic Nucleotide Phosphodiesterase 1A [Manis pentadactyla]|nr:Calcium/Calmodulin-Dependent 3',5'-Cyclic Nucleotide Phosphodiesterase 1A [Manis pentadactyla]
MLWAGVAPTGGGGAGAPFSHNLPVRICVFKDCDVESFRSGMSEEEDCPDSAVESFLSGSSGSENCPESTEKIIIPLLEDASKAETSSYGAHRLSNKKGPMNNGTYFQDSSLESVDLKSFKNNLVDINQQNRGGKS